MPAEEIKDKSFNEGTLTKLQLFELYARAWLPVFTTPFATNVASPHSPASAVASR